MAQGDWWWCHKCQGLFFAGNPGSVCPAGGEHEKPTGGAAYLLPTSDETAQLVGQDDGSAGGCFQAGVRGESQSACGHGVVGITSASFEPPDFVRETLKPAGSPNSMIAGVAGINWGMAASSNPAGFGGVVGRCDAGSGVVGISDSGRGVWGLSDSFIAAVGDSTSGTGVMGHSQSGTGVIGVSGTGRGVWGQTDSSMATVGDAKTGTGVWGHSLSGPGVHAESDTNRGIEARGHPAGHFDGDVEVTGTITAHDVVLSGADCAEEFDSEAARPAEPGTVVVLTAAGTVEPSSRPYDTKVVGVVSGAGDYQPAVVLDRKDRPGRAPVALVGKVYCKVDAGHAAIDVGDLLTTSGRAGHAMKATDPSRTLGAVLGKALQPLRSGQGLIPVLIGLQ